MRSAHLAVALAALGTLASAPCRAQRAAPPVTVVTGTLLGSDGAPMKLAEVLLRRGLGPGGTTRSLVGGDGRYAIATPLAGPLFIQFTGVDHYAATIPLVVERAGTIVLDVRLKHYAYTDSLDRLAAIGDWNHFAFSPSTPLIRQADGRYSATVPVDSTADSLAYELLGLEATGGGGHSINGTQPGRYVYDNGGDYRTVIPAKNGHATIVFDPSQLDRRPSALTVTFADPRSAEARAYTLSHAWSSEEQAYFDSSRAARARHGTAHYAWGPVLHRLRAVLAGERDPLLRQMLLFELVDATTLADSGDTALYRRFIADVPAASPWYSLYANALNSTFYAYRAVYGSEGPRHRLSDSAQRRLLERDEQIAAAQPDSAIQAMALESAVFMAKALHDDRRFNADYTALVTRYPDSPTTRFVESQLAPDRPLREGVRMPDFRFVALQDSSVVYTPASFAGKPYLLDFWASWCGPCVADMKNLAAAHDSLAPQGVEMLSVSLDNSRQDVAEFRAGQWKMPWLQAFAAGGFNNAQLQRLEILGIPTLVLVGRDGKILAVDSGMQGDSLLPGLRRALHHPTSP